MLSLTWCLRVPCGQISVLFYRDCCSRDGCASSPTSRDEGRKGGGAQGWMGAQERARESGMWRGAGEEESLGLIWLSPVGMVSHRYGIRRLTGGRAGQRADGWGRAHESFRRDGMMTFLHSTRGRSRSIIWQPRGKSAAGPLMSVPGPKGWASGRLIIKQLSVVRAHLRCIEA